MNCLHRIKNNRNIHFFTLLLVGILAMLAFISVRHFFRIDLTGSQQYSISKASKNIMRELDDIVTVKVFFSKELPPNLFTVKQYTEDILSDLSSFSKGHLSVRFLDPSDEAVSKEAVTLGIPPIRMNILAKDKFEVKNGFLGIALMYADQYEIIPVVQSTQNLEYDLISSVKKLITPEVRRVGFTTGHGEYSILQDNLMSDGDNYNEFSKSLEKNYKLKEIDLKNDSTEGIHTLIVGGPKESFSEDEKYALDQFLMKGGHLVYLVPSVYVDSDLKTSVVDTNLTDLLTYYGVTTHSSLVLDTSNETASFAQGVINFIVPYPLWVKVLSESFDTENPIVSKLESLVLPWGNPLTIDVSDGVRAATLAKTTDSSWLQNEPFNLDPNAPEDIDATRMSYDLIAILAGDFNSFYSDSYSYSQKEGFLSSSDGKGRMIVIGNARFITDRVLQQFPQNLKFILNTIDYLTLDESLIGIRSKTVSDRPLKNLSGNQRQWVKMIGIFLMPILVVVFGIFRYIHRKKQRIVL